MLKMKRNALLTVLSFAFLAVNALAAGMADNKDLNPNGNNDAQQLRTATTGNSDINPGNATTSNGGYTSRPDAATSAGAGEQNAVFPSQKH